ncbi:hypothetical protein ASPBRDRAFT_48565 [Aspergillus brasiliensis CBS 101740]|uniref:Uncharacterized protein n=1 Tax=Aspergillus brasiliensis (strain CBS 101740 / IMI 381727 / IBT 21946) TaxID=767769 RepID=A0A1L9U5S9_ASPBC|nr:hypothetical protein ASPBRDRAFT_48565 [Aspergillus brasiliensis CBS 101740]
MSDLLNGISLDDLPDNEEVINYYTAPEQRASDTITWHPWPRRFIKQVVDIHQDHLLPYFTSPYLYICCCCGDGPKPWDNGPCSLCHNHVKCSTCYPIK